MDAQSSISNPIIENLCKRYASGRVVKTRAEIAAEERARTLEKVTCTEAETVEIKEEVIESYKNGSEYMTSEAFAEMFRARRRVGRTDIGANIEAPSAGNAGERKSTVASYSEGLHDADSACTAEYSENIEDTEIYEAYNRIDIGEKEISASAENLRRINSRKNVISRIWCYLPVAFAAIKDWIDYDPKVLRIKRHKKSFPLVAFAAVVVIAVALFLVVSGSVKLMEADSEIAELKSQISKIEDTEALLNSRLEEKNNLAEIERIASEHLGMIRSEYVSVRFVDGMSKGSKNNGVVSLYKTDDEKGKSDNAVIGTLLSALGFGK